MHFSPTCAAVLCACALAAYGDSISARAPQAPQAPQSPQEYELLADINPFESDGDANPREFVTLNGRVYFVADGDGVGRELFSTDGTSSGTRLVVDIAPGVASSAPCYLTVLQGQLYFLADDGVRGNELWVSDGTAPGTRLVAELVPGAGSPAIRSLCAAGGKLFLQDEATIYVHAPATAAILDLQESGAPPRFRPAQTFAFAGTSSGYYFLADDGLRGDEPWFSDGTRSGTRLAADLAPGPRSCTLSTMMASHGGIVVSIVSSQRPSSEVYYLDAPNAVLAALDSPASVKDLGFLRPVGQASGKIWFAEAKEYFPTTRQVWIAEPVAGSLRILQSTRDGTPTELAAAFDFGGQSYFFARDAREEMQLWRSDGTPSGTYVLFAAPFIQDGLESVQYLRLANSVFYFTLMYADRAQLWRSDGTLAGTKECAHPAGTSPTKDFWTTWLAETLGSRLVLAFAGPHGSEPWVTDGTSQGSSMLANLVGPSGLGHSKPLELNEYEGRLYFAATHYLSGRELWTSDGTAKGTHLLADIQPGKHSSSPSHFCSALGRLFFHADDGVHGLELWVSDGTAAGTRLLRDLSPGPQDTALGSMLEFDGRLFFTASTAPTFWVSDGSEAGTVPLSQFVSNFTLSTANTQMTRAGDKLYFLDTSGKAPMPIAVLDAGARQLHYLTGPVQNEPYRICGDLGGALYFFSRADQGCALWSTRGTAATTTQHFARDVEAGTVQGDRLWLVLSTQPDRRQFALSDGTAAGTQVFASLAWSWQSYVRCFRGVGTKLWFGVEGTPQGDGLYCSDGTSAGTVHVLDRTPSSNQATATTDPEGLWFLRPNFPLDPELWFSDGTPQGTYAIASRHPVLPLAAHSFGAPLGGRLTIVGKSVQHGLELFVQKHGPGRHPLGRRCGEDSPWLDTSLPRLGQTLQIEGGSAPQGSAGIVLLGGDPSAPLPLPGVDCRLYVDPTQLAWAQPFAVTQPHWQLGLAVPNVPGLVGLRLAVQSVYLSPSLALQASEGIQLLLGR